MAQGPPKRRSKPAYTPPVSPLSWVYAPAPASDPARRLLEERKAADPTDGIGALTPLSSLWSVLGLLRCVWGSDPPPGPVRHAPEAPGGMPSPPRSPTPRPQGLLCVHVCRPPPPCAPALGCRTEALPLGARAWHRVHSRNSGNAGGVVPLMLGQISPPDPKPRPSAGGPGVGVTVLGHTDCPGSLATQSATLCQGRGGCQLSREGTVTEVDPQCSHPLGPMGHGEENTEPSITAGGDRGSQRMGV